MVHHFVQLLPREAPAVTLLILLISAVVGAVLWLSAVRFSRFLMTLLAVTLGALIGMNLPGWLGWQISGAGPAVGAAVVLGVSAFVFHGMWMGLLLGSVLLFWTTLVLWIMTSDGQQIIWPAISETTTPASWGRELWSNLPATMTTLLPYAGGACMITGLACAIIWTRLTTVLAWSATGFSMALFSSLAAITFSKPQWLGGTPEDTVQIAVVLSAIMLGAFVQWRLMPNRKKTPPKAKSPKNAPPEL